MNSSRRLFIAVLYGISLTLPLLVPSLANKLVVALAVAWVFTRPAVAKTIRSHNLLLVFVLLFALMAIGLAYTVNLTQGLSDMEDAIILLVLPLVLMSSETGVDVTLIRKILGYFVAGVIVLNLSSLFLISYDAWDPGRLQSKIIEANEVIARIHPAYTSLYISFCIFFIFDQHFPLPSQRRNKLGWIVFSLVVLFVYLFWINSRAGILAFIAAALFFVGYKWDKHYRLIGYFILFLFIGLLMAVPYTRFRFINAPKFALSADIRSTQKDANIFPIVNRMQIYSCDMELVRWPSLLYGYGTGDARDVLQESFKANGFDRPLMERMDAHNEFFAQLHRHGILGLGLFLALLILPFRHALKYKSPLLGAFIVLFAVTALFENVFSVQKGITFFAFFCPLLWLFARQAFARREESAQSVTA